MDTDTQEDTGAHPEDEILNTIPHRPPFLFIDEVVEVTGEGATARREIRADEPQFIGHYPGNPIMPGVLLCEATFQTAAVYLVKKLAGGDGDGRGGGDAGPPAGSLTPILSRILVTKFKTIVRPGDVITITVTFKETTGGFHFLRGKIVNQDGKVVLTNEFVLALIPAEKG